MTKKDKQLHVSIMSGPSGTTVIDVVHELVCTLDSSPNDI